MIEVFGAFLKAPVITQVLAIIFALAVLAIFIAPILLK